jgi:hypothetical protein
MTNGVAEPQRAKVVRFALEHRFDHIQSRASTASASPRSEPTIMLWKCSASGRTRPGWSATILNADRPYRDAVCGPPICRHPRSGYFARRHMSHRMHPPFFDA